jgi:hypothetical protein
MKTTFTLVLLTFFISSISAIDAPEAVVNAFSKQFPNITKVKWEKEKENLWEGEFKLDGIEYSACFDNEGNWIETEQEINMKDIPITIKAAIEKEFPGFKIEDVELIETASGKTYNFLLLLQPYYKYTYA